MYVCNILFLLGEASLLCISPCVLAILVNRQWLLLEGGTFQLVTSGGVSEEGVGKGIICEFKPRKKAKRSFQDFLPFCFLFFFFLYMS